MYPKVIVKRTHALGAASLILLAALAIPVMITARDTPRRPSATELKSHYYELEGMKVSDNDFASGYEMYRHAVRANPEALGAAFNMSWMELFMLDAADTTARQAALATMRRYVDTYPGEYTDGELYANLVQRFDNNPREIIRVLSRIVEHAPERVDNYDALAQAYLELNDTASALRVIDAIERTEGETETTVMARSYIRMSAGDTVAALAETRRYIDRQPSNSKAHMMHGNLLFKLGRDREAEEAMLRAERLAPDDFSPKMELSGIYLMRGDTVAADVKMTEALATNDLSVDDKQERLITFISAVEDKGGDLRRTLPMIDALLRQEPHNLSVLFLKATVLTSLQRFAEANENVEHILSIDSVRPPVWEMLIANNYGSEDYPAVRRNYRRAQQTLGQDITPKMTMLNAYSYSMEKDYRRSADAFEAEVRRALPDYTTTLAPDSLPALVRGANLNGTALAKWIEMIGDQYVSMGDTTGGFRIYDQALALDPASVSTLNNYAYFMALRGENLEKALEMSRATITAEPNNPTYLDTYAYILFKMRDFERALMYQDMAIQNFDPAQNSSELYSHYGDILFMLGRPDEALASWEKALKLDPENELLQRKVKNKTFFYK